MNDVAIQVINAFSTLPPAERHAVLVELARISEADAGAITDEELTSAGAELFAMYDNEENDVGNAGTRLGLAGGHGVRCQSAACPCSKCLLPG